MIVTDIYGENYGTYLVLFESIRRVLKRNNENHFQIKEFRGGKISYYCWVLGKEIEIPEGVSSKPAFIVEKIGGNGIPAYARVFAGNGFVYKTKGGINFIYDDIVNSEERLLEKVAGISKNPSRLEEKLEEIEVKVVDEV